MKRPIAIDLFCGAGGMSLGIEASGFKVESAVELDPIHSAVHKFNFPECNTICNDVSGLDVENVAQGKEVDLIVGGPPCQGFSQIGQRQLDDPRNSLVFEYVRFIKGIKPKYFIFENVPGIASGKHRKFLDELVQELVHSGYHVQKPKVLNAASFGAPQNRKRLIILGTREGLPLLEYPQPTHSENSGLNLLGVKDIVGAKSAIGDLENVDVFVDDDKGVDPVILDYKGYRIHYSFDNLGQYEKCDHRTFEDIKVYNHVGSKHTQQSIDRFAVAEQGKAEPISRFFKLHPALPCNTIRAGTASDRGAYTAPRPIHYRHPRCISVREAARLHTYPDWFLFHQTIWHGFREIGNSVVPLFAKALGDQVINALNVNTESINPAILEPSDKSLLQMNMGDACSYFKVGQVIPPRRRLANVV